MSSILDRYHSLTKQILVNPYSAEVYLRRAVCHEDLGFPDLAAGDAYKALLLIDEIQDPAGQYHIRALEALYVDQSMASYSRGLEGSVAELSMEAYRLENTRRSLDVVQPLLDTLCLQCYEVLTSNLTKCGSLRSAYTYCERALQSDPKNENLQTSKADILRMFKSTRPQDASCWSAGSFDPKIDLSDRGSVRREIYPWNIYEPDRLADSSLSVLNKELSRVASKCSIKAISLPLLSENGLHGGRTVRQLGIFATDDISPGETVLLESSVLTANNRLHDPLCDACSSELPLVSLGLPIYSCGDCDDTVFCSQSCMEDALTTYHPAVCGKDIETVGKDPEPSEAAESLYLLLLARVMALAETQGLHPLHLKETKFIWGDFIRSDDTYFHSNLASPLTTARHLPFSFKYNIISPLHVLEKMGIDIFAEVERYDFWIFNTLYAKFRGTASGRLNKRNGRPEVSAVHPIWSLANHSCAPNVRWEWAGKINFKAREDNEIVCWGSDKPNKHSEGIRKGEEILNHYCDVGLPVQLRREWAFGALGGVCICERCIWEAESDVTQA